MTEPDGVEDTNALPHPTVVGIGTSAGGLAALRRLLAKVPDESGISWVIVMHLAPERESHLPELLQSHTRLPVRQVTKTVRLEPDHVYVIPPNANLEAVDTHLRLSALEPRRRERAPVDHFLRTLAATHDGDAIGVILTGTGSDGTLGLKEIKHKGGLAIVQDPREAEHDGMPHSAIAGGLVDLILPLERIPEAVLGYARTRPKLAMAGDDEKGEGDEPRQLQRLFAHLRARTDRDFTLYKRSTILRRIGRRMQLRRLEELREYVELVRADRQEALDLADDLLITVTNFFRDPQVFDMLSKDVVSTLFEHRGPDDQIRVWSVGCATGEEAYSLAIILLEEAERHENPPRIQIFASDIHERSLERAREGFYPGDIETDVSPQRLKRYFQKEENGYRIRKDVRELVVFASHNLLADPPFSRIDLLACRNVLIYLRRDIQPDVYDLFHYALRQDGILVIGTSERIDAPDLVRVLDTKQPIYRKRNIAAPEPRLPVFPMSPRGVAGSTDFRADRSPVPSIALGSLHQRLLERYAPPSLLVGPDDKVVHLSEHAGRYLVHPGGALTSDVFQLVREELRIELRATLQGAREKRRVQRSRPVDMHLNGASGRVTLDVRPSLDPSEDGYWLVIFSEDPPSERSEEEEEEESGIDRDPARLRAIESERDEARQRLQAVIEEYETSREEMRASNEELQSTNEELRSTMEELETSKEELQSMNEELQTVNQENRNKVEDLAQLTADLQNLLAATEIATVFLDRDLRILRFTPRMSDLFSIRITDRGRPLSDLRHRLLDAEIIDGASEVLKTLVPIEREVDAEEGQAYLTRVMPYRGVDDRIMGVVMTFVDITDRRRAEDELRAHKLYAESIVETLHEPVLVLDSNLRVKSANSSFHEHFRVSPDGTEGRLIYELGDGQWDIPALRELLEGVLPRNDTFNDFRVEHEFDGIGPRTILVNGRRLAHADFVLLGFRDVTKESRHEQAWKRSEERFRALTRAGSDAVYFMDPSWTEMRRLEGGSFLPDMKDPSDHWLSRYIPSEEQPRVLEAIEEALRTKTIFHLEHSVRRADGTIGRAFSRAVPVLDDDGEIAEWIGAAIDLADRRDGESDGVGGSDSADGS